MSILSGSTYLSNLRSSFDELRESLDLNKIRTEITEINKVTEKVDFWSTNDAQEKLKQLSMLQYRLSKFTYIETSLAEIEALVELLSQEDDLDLERELIQSVSKLKTEIEEFKILILLDGEYDSSDAIVSIHAGAGGLDSQDWAEILYRMYFRWSENKSYLVKIIDELSDQEGGIKNVTFSISGENVYGYLKGEQGVHRLVRISPFDSAKRRHTSFASVEVMPILPDTADIEIRPEDLRLDTFRSSGAGGQYVNMTDSAVRITHIPSGIVVSCQTERSQHMNRATAMQVLRSKLYEQQRRERNDELKNIKGDKMTIAWGSQIRSYTMQPFQLIKDHRSGCEIGNVQSVLDGNLDELIFSYLRTEKGSNY
ncbi:MAG: peptide chain release factor 2 [Synergistaceae bacterium]